MIILVGLPKSGTTSFNDLFLDIGIKSHHFRINDKIYPQYRNKLIGQLIRKNYISNKPLLSFIPEKDYTQTAITETNCFLKEWEYCWPQIEYLDILYKENPDALFILHTRNIYKMVSSMHNHCPVMIPYLPLFDRIMMTTLSKKCAEEGIKVNCFNNIHSRNKEQIYEVIDETSPMKTNPELLEKKKDEIMGNWIQTHYQNIRHFFSKDGPTEGKAKFVEVDIEDNLCIEKLRPFIPELQAQPSITTLPHSNINNGANRQRH